MWCITGGETTVEALCQRFARHATAELQEVRIDLLDSVEAPALESSGPLLLACRAARQGGGFEGSEHERLSVLGHWCDRLRPSWIDFEADADPDLWQRLRRRARDLGCQLLASHHMARVDDSAGAWLDRGRELGADAVKLAATVEDAADLEPLFHTAQAFDYPRVIIGMGAPGLLSRALYPRFGSLWSYVPGDESVATAPGQLRREQVESWQLPPRDDADLFVLLGDRQIESSPAPWVFNPWFRRAGVNACYLPVITARPAQTVKWLSRLGLRGASVAVSLERELVPLLDVADASVQQSGVVNTLRVDDEGRLVGTNTPGSGAVSALEYAGEPAELEMWRHRGRLQLAFWLDKTVEAHELRREL